MEGHDTVAEAAGTKHLKPDLEVACPVEVDGEPAVLLLGSDSTPRRMRGVLVRLEEGRPVARAADLHPLYERVASASGTATGSARSRTAPTSPSRGTSTQAEATPAARLPR
ncbi:DUF6910 family protein [Geodermatophilus sp. URMC 63]